MFLKIIHKSEASYLCCYQERSYTESTGRSFSNQYLCPNIFNVRGYSGRFQDWPKQNKVPKILDNIIVIGKELSNQRTAYQKTATGKAAFI